MSFELFEHTADVGLRMVAPSFEGLCADAARGLAEVLIARPERIEPRAIVALEVAGQADDYLLFDWLAELLHRFETGGWLTHRADVTRSADGLSARLEGERFDAERHGRGYEVKAITYHGLRVIQVGDGWLGEVIVDI